MRDLHEVIRQKQTRLQELQNEIGRIEGQLEVLQSAVRVIEEDDTASTGPMLAESKGVRRWPETATSSPEKSLVGEKSAKQFP
jgi:hypothetical protein